jgi:hypothetical protein
LIGHTAVSILIRIVASSLRAGCPGEIPRLVAGEHHITGALVGRSRAAEARLGLWLRLRLRLRLWLWLGLGLAGARPWGRNRLLRLHHGVRVRDNKRRAARRGRDHPAH